MIKFLRRQPYTPYVEEKEVSITIGSGGGTDTFPIEDVAKVPDTALEVEIEGKRYILLAYERVD